MSEYAGRQFVGIDLHRRRSVLVRTTECGDVLEATRILNDVDRLNAVMARAGEDPEVVLEATYGWYWAVDALQASGAQVHLAHPLGVKAFEYRRVKNDFRDAADLADLLRMGRLPEAWIAPPATRELRELVRHRAKLVGLRSGCKAEVHAVLAKCGIQVPMSDLFGLEGTELLERINAAGPLRGAGAVAAAADRGPGGRDRPVRPTHPRAAGRRPRLRRGAAAARDRADPGRGVRRRGRRCHPVRQGRAAGLLGRPDAQASRVRHPRAPGPDHQAGLPAGPVGRGGVGQADRPAHRGRRLQDSRSPTGAGRTSAPWPQPASRSSSSTTRCATTTSVPCTRRAAHGASPGQADSGMRPHDLDDRPRGRAGHDPRDPCSGVVDPAD